MENGLTEMVITKLTFLVTVEKIFVNVPGKIPINVLRHQMENSTFVTAITETQWIGMIPAK